VVVYLYEGDQHVPDGCRNSSVVGTIYGPESADSVHELLERLRV